MTVDLDDIVAYGNRLDPEILARAYQRGIFPWPIEGLPVIPWFSPRHRAVLDRADLHVPRSLARARRQSTLDFTIDAAFDRVIERCATIPRDDNGTWITPKMLAAYKELHRRGHAHSIEAWQDGELVAGVYGVDGGGYFSAESMFREQPNASKLALLFLMEHLHSRGLDWMDIQVLTPHMELLGGKHISRQRFQQRIERARGNRLFP